jgi:hypothetical protein
MRINSGKFCSLATSPSWQAWLCGFDRNLYNTFIRKLHVSKGCNQNQNIMLETLKEIEVANGAESLHQFIEQNYPQMIIKDEVKIPVSTKGEVIFEYNPNVLTYPHRIIMSGDGLKRKAQSFLLDKIKGDYVIVGDKVYIEYLKKEDAYLANKIPVSSWLIAAWRLKQKS